MYSVSNAYSKAINADTRSVLYKVTLAGAIVADQTRIPKMVITESVGDTSGVAIGTANSSSLTLTLKKANTINYNGILVEPESGLVLPDGSIEWLPLGKFWVTDFQTSNDYETVNLSCADGMFHLSGEFVSELTYPTDIKNVVNEFCAKTGVVFVSSLPELEIRRKPEGMTYREVIGYLAGCCGKNARFNRLGQLEFFWYEDSGVTIERKNQYLNGMTKLNDKPLEVSFEVIGQNETYTVTCVTDDNGGMTATPGRNVLEGDTVVLSINPFNGYELADISAITDAGDKVTLRMDSEGGRTFVQPDSNVTVTASFRIGKVGPFNLNVRSDGNGGIRSNKTLFNKGDTATIYISPDDGYELDKLTTIPAGISLTRVGTNANGETIYDFTIPESDVTVIVAYKEIAVKHSITAYVAESEHEAPGYLYIEGTFTGEFPLRSAVAGTNVSVTVSPNAGYEFDYFDSSVTLTQMGSSTYTFIMPDEDVSIVVHYKLSEDESKRGQYSWLALPEYNTPPTSKPYWAVFYKDDWNVPTCKKFYLVWFDGWSATGYNVEGDKRIYTVKFDGYYYCGSQDTGHLPQAWDISTWNGNGASGSTLTWGVYAGGHAWSGDSIYSLSGDYCLLASNVHLFYGSSMIFEKCENAILFPRTGYTVDGVDVREKGSLTNWKCPDTFSTPLPAKKWMILNCDGSLAMTPNENGTGYTGSDHCEGFYILFYDDILIENIGAVFSDSDEEFYVATVSNGHYAAIKSESSTTSWTLYDVADGDVFGLRSPLHGCNGTYEMLGRYYFSGVLATNTDLWSSGDLFMYKNDCRICDCASNTEVEPIRMFSFRNTRAVSDNELVTIPYENPLVYEKMVDTVSSLVQGITYTPAKVKHRGNPAFQVGDIIRTPDKNGTYHTVIIMQQTMNFGGGMNSEITCPGKSEKSKQFSSNGPMTSQIKKEVQQSSFELERQMSANNAAVYAALYKTIGTSEAKITSILEWQTEKSATLAKVEQIANEDFAAINSLAEWKGETNNSVSKLEQIANEQGASISLLTDYTGLKGVISVDNKAEIDAWDKEKIYCVTEENRYYAWRTASGKIVTSATDDTVFIESEEISTTSKGHTLFLTIGGEPITYSYGNTIVVLSQSMWIEVNAPLSDSIAKIEQTASEHEASIKLLTEWNGETNQTLTSILQTSNEHEASIKSLAEWRDAVNNNFASIEQRATEQGASISLLANYSGLKDAKTVDMDADRSSWNKENAYHVTATNKYYVWRVANGNMSVTANNNTISLSSTAISVTPETNTLKLTVEDELLTCSYGQTVAIISQPMWLETDVPLSDSMAKIEQTVFEHGASINLLAEWRGETNASLAELTQKVDENSASIGLVVESGNVKAGIIMEAINNDKSSMKISADKLDIEGETLNIKVEATNIEGKLTAGQIDAAELKVAAANIEGKLTAEQIDASSLTASEVLSTDGTRSVNIRDGEIGLLIGNAAPAYISAIASEGTVGVNIGAPLFIEGQKGLSITINGMTFVNGILVSVS